MTFKPIPPDLLLRLKYDESSSTFLRWIDPLKKSNKHKEAGHITKRGYSIIHFRKQTYQCHRIVWAIHNEDRTDLTIDHKDRNPKNNKISNLRLATRSEQSDNRDLLVSNPDFGVWWWEDLKKWRVRVGKYRGCYDSKEEAIEVRNYYHALKFTERVKLA
jgi:hypothetical protein